ncbi:MAG TPA: hypothetical protein VLU91_01250, partial [Nitrososphaerales archaeon]|nr:hypothetical protein [Nitrososphaerales archaeon]
MASLGTDWYQTFWDGFLNYSRESMNWDKEYTDKEWTGVMFQFLQEMAEDMNYHWEKEEKTIKGSRFDMTWHSSDKPVRTIFIEHENQWVDAALREEV